MAESFVLDRLRRLRGKPRIRQFATIDIETTQWVNPYAVGFYDGKDYFDFIGPTCIVDALTFVLQPKYTGYWIYAHNGGNFDFLFFLRQLAKKRYWRYRIDITPIQSTVIRIDVGEIDKRADPVIDRHTKIASPATKRWRRWTFIDSARLMPVRLNQVGETFGIGKKVELKGMSYDDLAKPENREVMRHYLKQDCVLLYDGLVTFQGIVNNLGGELSVTLPSTAMDIYRRKFLKQDVFTNRHLVGCQGVTDEKDERAESGKRSVSRVRGATGKRGIRKRGRGPYISRPSHGRSLPAGGIRTDTGKHGADSAGMRGSVSGNGAGRVGGHSVVSGKHEGNECRGCAHDFIRNAYYGGRTEIFRMKFEPSPGHELAKMYDINSHYPHCMLDAMPTGILTTVEGQDEAFVFKNSKTKVGIVECDVYIPPTCYLPPLPYRRGGKLIFPVGNFHGTWDAAELCLLPLVGGRITRVTRSGWFDAAPIFAKFIHTLYKFRNKKNKNYNKGMAWIAKILMNSLYGKWAMKEERMKIIMRPESPEGLYCVDLASDVWAERVTMKPNYIVPQLSVHVAALARVRLWESLKGAVDAGGRIYYCDTDSIVCSGVEIPTGPELGQMKLEDGTIKRAEFVLPKLYLIESDLKNEDKKREEYLKIKAKGMGPGIRVGVTGDDELAGQLSEQEFVDMIKKGVPIQRHRLTKLREGLRDFAAKAMEFPRIVASPKQIQSEYDKRTVLDDYDTVPIVL